MHAPRDHGQKCNRGDRDHDGEAVLPDRQLPEGGSQRDHERSRGRHQRTDDGEERQRGGEALGIFQATGQRSGRREHDRIQDESQAEPNHERQPRRVQSNNRGRYSRSWALRANLSVMPAT
jgi:hypothetical protein